jgi:hypothetical protein
MGDFDWIRHSDIVPTLKNAETVVKREDVNTKGKDPQVNMLKALVRAPGREVVEKLCKMYI